jgi:MFS family permease
LTGNNLPADRGKGLSVSAIAVAVSACAGPSLGGFLATTFGWQSIFFVKVPIGIVITILAIYSIPKDIPGAFAYAMRITCMVTACCAAVALVLSLVKGKAEKSSRRGDMKNAS